MFNWLKNGNTMLLAPEVRQLNEAVFLLDRDLNILDVTPWAAQERDKSVTELCGASFLALWKDYPENERQLDHWLRAFFGLDIERPAHDITMEYKRKDGTPMSLSFECHPLPRRRLPCIMLHVRERGTQKVQIHETWITGVCNTLMLLDSISVEHVTENDLVSNICQILVKSKLGEIAAIFALDSGDELKVVATEGTDAAWVRKTRWSADPGEATGRSLMAVAIRQQYPSLISVLEEPSPPWMASSQWPKNLGSMAAIPLFQKDKIWGVLLLGHHAHRIFHETRTEIMMYFSEVIERLMRAREQDRQLGQLQQDLRQNDSSWQILLESIPVPLLIRYPHDGKIKFCNDSLCLVSGYSRDKLLSMTVEELLADDNETHSNNGVRWMLAHEEQKIPVNIRQVRVMWERKPAQLEFWTNSSHWFSARDNSAVANVAFSRASDAMVITDTEFCILDVNKAFGGMTGLTLQDARNQNIVSILLPTQINAADFLSDLKLEQHWSGELLIRGQNDQIFPCWLSVSTLEDESSRYNIGYLWILSDLGSRNIRRLEASHISGKEPLTGLVTKDVFMEFLGQAIGMADRSRHPAGLLFIDLDNYSRINDLYGHEGGDTIIKLISHRLIGSVRTPDTVGRYTGDEFVIVLPKVGSQQESIMVAQRILERLAAPISFEEDQLHIKASIGISLYPQDGRTPEMLLRNAETAMFYAKRNGGAQVQKYDHNLAYRAKQKLTMEAELRRAIERNELMLRYQPRLFSATGLLSGFEALVRWHHPERGLLYPGAFIPLAEESGLLNELNEWVLFEACRQAYRWLSEGLLDYPIAINISPEQFKQRDLVSVVRTALHATKLDPAYLEIELTENSLMHDGEASVINLRAMKDMGITIAIDDFGTGYSSLAYLNRLPADKLKIDRSFVMGGFTNNKQNAEIVRTIVNLAHTLKMGCVAEGVETEEQSHYLLALRCDEIQGFYYSYPLSVDAVDGCLRASKNHPVRLWWDTLSETVALVATH